MKKFVFAFTVLLLIACEKDDLVNDIPMEVKQTSMDDVKSQRENLENYQEYLKNIRDNINPKHAFNLDDCIINSEHLLNIKYSNPSLTGKIIAVPSHEFNYSNDQSIYSLHQRIKQKLELSLSEYPDKELYILDVNASKQADGHFKISCHSIFKEQDYQDIDNRNVSTGDPFEEGEEYLLWLGGTIFYPFFDGTMSCEDCGEYVANTAAETGAIREIETRINANYPDPPCPNSLNGWKGTFRDVQTSWTSIEWNYPEMEACTDFSYYTPCDCLDHEVLNCIYGYIYDEIDHQASPINIPDNYYFINMVAGVDFISIGEIENFPTKITIDYWYGKPNCGILVYDGPRSEIQMDIDFTTP